MSATGRWLWGPSVSVNPETGLLVPMREPLELGNTQTRVRLTLITCCEQWLSRMPHERFLAALLDHQYRLMGVREVGAGSNSAVVVDKPDLVRAMSYTPCTSLVLLHNHPAGSVEPSAGDDQTTSAVCVLAEALGVMLFDHLIVADGGRGRMRHHSYRAAGSGLVTQGEVPQVLFE